MFCCISPEAPCYFYILYLISGVTHAAQKTLMRLLLQKRPKSDNNKLFLPSSLRLKENNNNKPEEIENEPEPHLITSACHNFRSKYDNIFLSIDDDDDDDDDDHIY
uniref:Uncharacterized protein n=1 Tax=Glossina pallidipes TaxID=7398 RepID=A0A1A9ZYH8_GLOPL